jgi:RNA polymerase sigma-70 factor (ECF subfamily)
VVERIHGSTAMARPFQAGVAPAALATPAELFGLIYRQMRALAGRRDVDELAQAAAEQAVRALPSFEGRSKLSTWTYRICYLTLRKHERWTRRWLRRFTLTQDGELPEPAAESSQADAPLLREERLRRLSAALDQVSSKRRTVVLLHDLEGLSVDEIAEIVGANARAVRSRLRDGRRALGEILKSDPYFGVEACRKEDG